MKPLCGNVQKIVKHPQTERRMIQIGEINMDLIRL